MALKGMDVELVNEFGNRMKNEFATTLRNLRSAVVNNGTNLVWEGSDAAAFKNDRLREFGADADRIANLIEELGQLAILNAQAQAEVSAHL